MSFAKRTHFCGELRPEHVGSRVTVNGWVNRIRDLGGLFFMDIRDRSGIVQLFCDVEEFPQLRSLRNEFVLTASGEVRMREVGTINQNVPTGHVEIVVDQITVLNEAAVLPFPVSDEEQMSGVNEELRIKHRYLDLRRPSMQKKLMLRAECVRLIREYLDTRGFVEIETPIFTKTTPEGARDYLVPYRLEPGKFYALPQSPQQYKQLLMVGGMERYYQIAKCFRDEAQRADRQPEFTQLDLEMSFVHQEDVLELAEGLTRNLCNSVKEKFALDLEPIGEFPRLTYDESMRRFGTDKPDLRFGLELFDVSEIVAGSEFSVFRNAVSEGGVVKGIRLPGGATFSRKQVSELEEFAKTFGAKGLAQLPIKEGYGGISKFLDETAITAIRERAQAEIDDMLLFVADTETTAYSVLSRLRNEIGDKLNLADPRRLVFCWVLDFPLVFWSEEEKRWDAAHHPFTGPKAADIEFLESDPGRVRADCYDIVCNGVEWASGSIRIHRPEVQSKVFSLLGIDEKTQRERFGHILDAFKLGAPPHGGIAPGIDRLVMLLLGESNIREVMAFPKIGGGYDPMMDAPGTIDDEQWHEMGLQLRKKSDGDIIN
ncbi:MAG: aspartate--tRNA ligase [Armatimonadota bacterium]|nr:aspartate--tRNA ligase [Armatimonadota bacterium]